MQSTLERLSYMYEIMLCEIKYSLWDNANGHPTDLVAVIFHNELREGRMYNLFLVDRKEGEELLKFCLDQSILSPVLCPQSRLRMEVPILDNVHDYHYKLASSPPPPIISNINPCYGYRFIHAKLLAKFLIY